MSLVSESVLFSMKNVHLFYDLGGEKYLLLKVLHSSHLEILLIPPYLGNQGNLVLLHGCIMCLFKYAYFPDTDIILEKTKHKQTY